MFFSVFATVQSLGDAPTLWAFSMWCWAFWILGDSFCLSFRPKPWYRFLCRGTTAPHHSWCLWFNHGLGCCRHPARRDVLLQGQVRHPGECSNIQMLKSIDIVFSSFKFWLMNSFKFLCVLSFFWRSHPQSSTPQQSLITNFWPDGPSNIDAAYESRSSDKVYLFKGLCFPYLKQFSRWHYSSLHA